MDQFGQTALHYCTENKGTKIATLVYGPILETKDVLGRTALHLAVIAGNVPMVRFLIKLKVNVNECDNENHTSFHFATGCNNLQIYNSLHSSTIVVCGNNITKTLLWIIIKSLISNK